MNYLEALQTLLTHDENERVQVLYLRLQNGKVLVFIGAPVSQEDTEQIEDIVFGEQIPPLLIGAMTMFSGGTLEQ